MNSSEYYFMNPQIKGTKSLRFPVSYLEWATRHTSGSAPGRHPTKRNVATNKTQRFVRVHGIISAAPTSAANTIRMRYIRK
jgi:hypothetical protein